MKKLILYAEDDRDIAEMYIRIFEYVGYDVHWAKDGQEALAKYKVETPDIIVLDIGMPYFSGFEVMKEIRIRDSVTPILMLTCDTCDETEIESYRLKSNDYIRKDVKNDVILSKIARQIDLNPASNNSALYLTPNTWLDVVENKIYSNGFSTKLHFREKNLLHLLWRHQQKQLKREWLESQVFGDKAENRDLELNKSISILRKSLAPDNRIQIKTKRSDSVTLVVEEARQNYLLQDDTSGD